MIATATPAVAAGGARGATMSPGPATSRARRAAGDLEDLHGLVRGVTLGDRAEASGALHPGPGQADGVRRGGVESHRGGRRRRGERAWARCRWCGAPTVAGRDARGGRPGRRSRRSAPTRPLVHRLRIAVKCRRTGRALTDYRGPPKRSQRGSNNNLSGWVASANSVVRRGAAHPVERGRESRLAVASSGEYKAI